jgi:hypothetical protein
VGRPIDRDDVAGIGRNRPGALGRQGLVPDVHRLTLAEFAQPQEVRCRGKDERVGRRARATGHRTGTGIRIRAVAVAMQRDVVVDCHVGHRTGNLLRGNVDDRLIRAGSGVHRFIRNRITAHGVDHTIGQVRERHAGAGRKRSSAVGRNLRHHTTAVAHEHKAAQVPGNLSRRDRLKQRADVRAGFEIPAHIAVNDLKLCADHIND